MWRVFALLVGAASYSRSGRTAPGRLSWVDAYLVAREGDALFAGGNASLFVDVGVGDAACTTVELALALGAAGPRVPTVLGLEADAVRAARARARCARVSGVAVRQTDGSLAVPLRPGEACVGARAMNVFRSGYREADAADAVRALGAALADGAPLVEGSCSRSGDAGVAHVLRKRAGALDREALLLAVDPRRARGVAPLALRPRVPPAFSFRKRRSTVAGRYLPRDLRWRFRSGGQVYAFWERWTAAWKAARRSHPDDAFRASAFELARRGEDGVEVLGPGLLLWRPAGGVPAG